MKLVKSLIATAATLVGAAGDLKNQVLQRLTLVDQRIAQSLDIQRFARRKM